MKDRVKPTRPYRSPKRQEQARATRRAIVDAAHRLFVERGYASTTVESVAAEAGVAVQTVYATMGSKVAILKAAVDIAIAGDDEPVPLADREEAARIAAEPDQRERLRLVARQIVGIAVRVAPLVEAVRAAAGASTEAAGLWEEIESSRLAGMEQVARMIAGAEGLAVPLDEARDTLWALFSPAVAVMLLIDRGWTPAQLEAWLARTAGAVLIGDHSSSGHGPKRRRGQPVR